MCGVWCVVCVSVGVCAVVHVLRKRGMCVLCFGVVVCCAVSLCVVLVLVLVCNVWCVVSVCGVCAWCVLCVCGVVCVCCVWRGLARGKNPVCRFKTSPCVHSKHGDVLNLHTGSLSLSLSSPSLFLSSFLLSLFLRSLSLLSSPSNNDNDHSFSRLSLYTKL